MDVPVAVDRLIQTQGKISVEKWVNTRKGLTFRLSRFWEVYDSNRLATKLQFIAIDKKKKAFVCSIGKKNVPMFKPFIEEGSIYTIRNFGVAKMRRMHRVLNDAEYYIILDSFTQLDKVCVNVPAIIRYKFQIIAFSDLIKAGNNGENLCDVIGQVTLLHEVERDVEGSVTLRTLSATLRDLSGAMITIRITTEDTSDQLNPVLESSDRICIFASMIVESNPSGDITVKSCDASRIYSTLRVREILDFHTRVLDGMLLHQPSSHPQIS